MNVISENMFALQKASALVEGRNAGTVGKAAKTAHQARKTAEDFEAVFIGQMLQPMFRNIGVEKPFGDGKTEAMWRSLLVDEYGKAIVNSGGFGIADQVYREILKMQEIN